MMKTELPELINPENNDLQNDDLLPPEEGDVYYSGKKKHHGVAPSMDEIIKKLETIYDPEVPANIYSMGLIYDIQMDKHGNVDVIMTLTSPMCPVAGSLPAEVADTLITLEDVGRCNVKITWTPPWTLDMMSDEARMVLGLL